MSNSFRKHLEVGQEVVLSSGIFGTVRALNEGRVELEAAPGTVLTVARQVVVRRVPKFQDRQPPDNDPDTTEARPRPGRVGPDQDRGLRRHILVAKKTPRPVRTLVVFGLSIAVLYGLAALGRT